MAKTISYGRCKWRTICTRRIYSCRWVEKAKQPVAMKDEEWEVLDRKALGTIQLCLASSVAFNISKEKTIEGVMGALSKLYKKPSASNKVFLLKSLFNKKCRKVDLLLTI